MKYAALISFFLLSLATRAQTNGTAQPVEPDRETSFENYELLIIAIAGLLLLMGLRYWFKKTRGR